MYKALLISFVLAIILLTVLILQRRKKSKTKHIVFEKEKTIPKHLELTYGPVQLVHNFSVSQNEASPFELDKKDSFEERLDELTKKLAEKEGRLKISRTKLRETQYEIDNMPTTNQNVRVRYRSIMTSLKTDLKKSERECKKLQQQILWLSRRRAEIQGTVEPSACHAECGGFHHKLLNNTEY